MTMTPPSGSRRVRLLALTLPLVAATLALLAWSQVWVAVILIDGREVVASGDAAAPAIPPFALAALALVGALSLAGVFFRIILGVLQALLGLGIAVSGVVALNDPVQAAASRITEASGVDGTAAVRALVDQVTVSFWPGLALVAGAFALVIGVVIAATASRWPRRTRRFEQSRTEPGEGSLTPDRLEAWDALSDGDDPTAR
jgi:hypothetical protein